MTTVHNDTAMRVYLCEKNHRFLVFGPHLVYTVHDFSLWVLRYMTGDPEMLKCACGARTKRAARIPKDRSRPAEAALRLGGMEAAAPILRNIMKTTTYGHHNLRLPSERVATVPHNDLYSWPTGVLR